MSDDNAQVIAEFDRPNGERIRISISEFKEKYYVDLRTYYEADEDEWRPTKKGVSIPVENFEEFKAAVEKAEEAIKAL